MQYSISRHWSWNTVVKITNLFVYICALFIWCVHSSVALVHCQLPCGKDTDVGPGNIVLGKRLSPLLGRGGLVVGTPVIIWTVSCRHGNIGSWGNKMALAFCSHNGTCRWTIVSHILCWLCRILGSCCVCSSWLLLNLINSAILHCISDCSAVVDHHHVYCIA